jgi:hypothetical protein
LALLARLKSCPFKAPTQPGSSAACEDGLASEDGYNLVEGENRPDEA